MEGLEAAEVDFSVLRTVIDYRIEAEYFDHKFLIIDKKLSKIETIPFTKVARFINGRPYNSECFNDKSGIRISKIGDVTNKRDINNWEFISDEEFKNQKGNLLVDGDILMTLTGDPPDVGKVNYIHNPNNASWNQRVAKIRIKKQDYYLSNETLFVVLSTEYARTQLERYAKGIRQRNLGNESLDRLLLPIFSKGFQKELENTVNKQYDLLQQSKTLYAEAEEILLDELGLKDWQPKNENVSIKTFSDFQTSGRLDAEYYQPKYDEIEKRLKCFLQLKITDCFDMFSNPSPSCYTDAGIKVIKTKNVRIPNADFDTITDYTNEKCLLVKNDDLLFASMGVGSLGRVCFIFGVDDSYTIDGTIKLLRTKAEYQNYYYEIPTMLFLTSCIGQDLIYKHVIGSTGIISISKENIANLQIPVLDRSIRKRLSELVMQSQNLKSESKRLLEEAKEMVEREIEKGGENG